MDVCFWAKNTIFLLFEIPPPPRHKKGSKEFVPYDRVSLYRDTQFTNILFGKEIVQVLIIIQGWSYVFLYIREI